MRFTKMEGLGNDFLVVDGSVEVVPELVRRLTDRRRGVGGDGVLQVTVENGMVHMGYWNADGGLAEMCGNGLRCVARYAFDRELVDSPDFRVMTHLGERRVSVAKDPRVEIGPVEVGETFEFEGWWFRRIGVGNPHAVAFVEEVATAPVPELGSELARMTPGGVNVEFVRIVARDKIEMRVWERGIGETMACGTGMVAAAAAAHRLDLTDANVTVRVPGGEASVELERNTSWLTGPANYVFAGEVGEVGKPTDQSDRMTLTTFPITSTPES